MNFINNWVRGILLTSDASTCALDLPDGSYRLTLADAAGASATRWEYVDASVSAGVATLTRGREGSSPQGWPVGSVVYCSITAELLGGIFQQLTSLQARVALLEAGLPANAVRVTAGVAGDPGGTYNVGWSAPAMGVAYGSVLPASISLPGAGEVTLLQAMILQMETAAELYLAFPGAVSVASIASVNVQGVGVLAGGDAEIYFDSDLSATVMYWVTDSHDWTNGAERLLTFTFV